MPESDLKNRRSGNGGSPGAQAARRWLAMGALLLAIGLPTASGAATTVHKCVSEGRVTYQNDPCPSGPVGKRPTVEELNAERLKRLQRQPAAPVPPAQTLPATANRPLAPEAQAPGRSDTLGRPRMPGESGSPFTCDGRTHCSQMHSCAEAKFFLARCPGTQMDGNHDGIPCERQWCK